MQLRLRNNLRPLVAALLGAILPLSQAPWNWWPIAIISICGLFLLLRNRSTKQTFWLCFSYALGMFSVGVSWVFVSIHDYGNASVLLAGALTALFVVALALIFAAPMSLLSRFGQHPVTTTFTFTSLWVITEWIRGWFLTGFPWLYAGYGFIDTSLSGWAPIGGVLALSWVVVFSASTLATALLPVKTRDGHSSLLSWLPALLTALLWCGGWIYSQKSWTTPANESLRIGLIQPSLPLTTKWDETKLNQILTLYHQLTRQLLEQDLIIWPESAIPQLEHNVSDYLFQIDRMARSSGTAIITGIPTQRPEDGSYYNSVIALGEAEGRYHKQHLVPFGEYVPLESWLRGTIDFFDLPMSQFSSGTPGQPLIKAHDWKISSAICYEIVFPDLVAESASQSQVLLTLSNDSWFGDSLGPKQHLQMARFRALENGKPLIRGTNDGITALVNASGEMTHTLPAFERGILTGTITPHTGTTPFNRWGSAPILWLSAILLMISSLCLRKTATPG